MFKDKLCETKEPYVDFVFWIIWSLKKKEEDKIPSFKWRKKINGSTKILDINWSMLFPLQVFFFQKLMPRILIFTVTGAFRHWPIAMKGVLCKMWTQIPYFYQKIKS